MTQEQRQKLFDYFAQEHGISLMGSDFNEIENMLKVVRSVTKEELFERYSKHTFWDGVNVLEKQAFFAALAQHDNELVEKLEKYRNSTPDMVEHLTINQCIGIIKNDKEGGE